MTWVYHQRSGDLLHDDRYVGTGYSGYGEGRDNPDFQRVKEMGPIPEGLWRIGDPFDSPTHGPFAMPLVPQHGTDTFGRSGFLIHGDNAHYPGSASLGCVILPRALREVIWTSGDHTLVVLE